MDFLEFFKIFVYALAPCAIAVLGYQQRQIHELTNKVSNMITRAEVVDMFRATADVLKDKMNDKYSPIEDRLDRIEDKLDSVIKELYTKE